MNLPKYWPVAVLFGAVLFYFWIDGEEPVPDKQAQQEKIATKSPIAGSFPATPSQQRAGQSGYQAPAYTPGQYPSGYTQPGQTGMFQAPYTDSYQFRNQDPIDNTSKPYSDPYGRPQEYRDNSYAMPAPEFQGYAGPGNVPVPDRNMTYRFRPQDEKKQPKRWQGNYARKPIPHFQPQTPYPYENQPPPVNQVGPATERKPLWANSWPER